ncbi:VPS37B [Cordylochernes scorpioides]|uniref:VPS37B n=1 Tax=Cordylochernes scorpioides TaxID=51811 RepID=A0ABY6K404_9ARAC|nr:VPS37B [Cordylochernes scorpioides]
MFLQYKQFNQSLPTIIAVPHNMCKVGISPCYRKKKITCLCVSQVKNLESEKEVLLASNKSIAEFNLNFEPYLQETRGQLTQFYQEASALKAEIEERKKTLDELTRQTSMDTTQALLQTLAAQTEEETEVATSLFQNLTTKFMANELTVEAFLEEFLAKRKLAHLRRVKAEKMADLLHRIPNIPANNQPLRPAPPAPTGANYYMPTPYPPNYPMPLPPNYK